MTNFNKIRFPKQKYQNWHFFFIDEMILKQISNEFIQVSAIEGEANG